MIAFFGDLACQLNPPVLNIQFGQQLSILNLEGPILDPKILKSKLPLKAGPRLYSGAAMLKSFFEDKPSWIFSLANNHSIDFGEEGLVTTLETLTETNIRYCGAGKNKEEANKALQIEVNGVGIAIISCADRGFGYATTDGAGFALEGNWVFQEIVLAKENKLVPIVLYHGGVEDFSLPSPYTKQLFESWADLGAKLVIGTHSHVPQPVTEYRNSLLCYGLGNFLVDPNDWRKSGSAAVSSLSLVFDPISEDFTVHHLKVAINKSGEIEVSPSAFSNELVHRLKVCSDILKDPELHTAVWQEMCIAVKSSWLTKHFVFAFVTEIAPSMFKKIPYFGKFFRIPFAIDTLAWSTHREMLLEISSMRSGTAKNHRNQLSSNLWSVVKGQSN
jgi:hypothetical protein